MLLLSIIVPFYNVECYIEQCVRSLYDQDIPYEQYEVICVDDCSNDGSRAIVERLQQEYPTLKICNHTKNKRQGGARNTGLNEATGQYIWFVDGDDYLCPNTLAQLIEWAAKRNLDILQFEYARKIDAPPKNYNVTEAITDGETYLFKDLDPRWYDRVSGPWQQLVRRRFLIEEQIAFVEEVQFEDTDYMLRAFLLAKKVQYVPIRGYIYRENHSSTTLTYVSPQKIAWQINQLVRCALLKDKFKTLAAKVCIEAMLHNTLSSLRGKIKKMSLRDKYAYYRTISPAIRCCKRYMTWRTWLAVRYGITWMINK